MSAPAAAAQRRSLVKRRITLAVLTLVNSTNFWQRNLLYALASVWPPNCLQTCEGATFVPICSSCGDSDLGAESEATCRACQERGAGGARGAVARLVIHEYDII